MLASGTTYVKMPNFSFRASGVRRVMIEQEDSAEAAEHGREEVPALGFHAPD